MLRDEVMPPTSARMALGARASLVSCSLRARAKPFMRMVPSGSKVYFSRLNGCRIVTARARPIRHL